MHIRRRSNTPSISLEPQLQTDNYRVLILPKPTSQNPRHRFGPQPKGMTAGFWHILPMFQFYRSNTPSISLGPQPQTDNCQVLTRIRIFKLQELFFAKYFLDFLDQALISFMGIKIDFDKCILVYNQFLNGDFFSDPYFLLLPLML